MSDLVGNTKDQFSRDSAHIIILIFTGFDTSDASPDVDESQSQGPSVCPRPC